MIEQLSLYMKEMKRKQPFWTCDLDIIPFPFPKRSTWHLVLAHHLADNHVLAILMGPLFYAVCDFRTCNNIITYISLFCLFLLCLVWWTCYWHIRKKTVSQIYILQIKGASEFIISHESNHTNNIFTEKKIHKAVN